MISVLFVFLTVWSGSLYGILPVEAAVDFRAGVNRDTMTIGDPIIFRMRLVRDRDDAATFEWDDSFPAPFEIVEKRPVQSVSQDGGRVEETTDMVLTIFQLGEVVIPPVTLKYVLASGDSGQISSRDIPVTIQSVKSPGETDIRDVKPPVDIKAKVPAWAWLTLAGFLGLVALLVWWIGQRKRRDIVVPPPPPINWMAELGKVKKMDLVQQGLYKQYFSLLSDILRRCLKAKTPVRAVEETTYEIARDLRADGVEDSFVQQIEAFLRLADSVKFAKFAPGRDVAQETMPGVEAILKVLVQPGPEVENTEPQDVAS